MVKTIRSLLLAFQPAAKYLLVIWVITIIVVSSLPPEALPDIKTDKLMVRVDYLIHFLEYAVLSWLTLCTFASHELTYTRWKIIIVVTSLILFSLADEGHQLLIPSRSFSFCDLVADILGLLSGFFIFRLIRTEL